MHVLTVARKRNGLGGGVRSCRLMSIPVTYDFMPEHVLEPGEARRRVRNVAAVSADGGQEVSDFDAFENEGYHVGRTRSSE